MSFKVCKKALLVVVFVMLYGSAAPAASSLLVGGGSGVDTGLERRLEGGITVICDHVTKGTNAIGTSAVYVVYTVLPDDDLVIRVSEVGDLFDDKGRRLNPSSDIGPTEIFGNGLPVKLGTTQIGPQVNLPAVNTI